MVLLQQPQQLKPQRSRGIKSEPTSELFKPKPKPVPIAPPEPEVDLTPKLLSAEAIMAPLCSMLATGFAAGLMLYVGHLASWMPAPAGLETIWLAPSMCPSGPNHYVSYIARGEDAGAGGPCPSHGVSSRAQEFLLPATLDWAASGQREAFTVFRGVGDAVTISFELKDATGQLLLSESGAKLGDGSSSSGSSSSSSGSGSGSGGSTVSKDAHRTTNVKRLGRSAPIYEYLGGEHTPFGASRPMEVSPGTRVAMMHLHSGYGRYYELKGCDDYKSGCELRVAEALTRDAFASNFTRGADLAFPLTLRVSQLDVRRSAAGGPSVFFAFYADSGGRSQDTVSNSMYKWVWLPITLFAYQLLKLIMACTEDDPLIRPVPPAAVDERLV